MHLRQKTFLSFAFLLGFLQAGFAQTYKGLWTSGGVLNYEQVTSDGNPFNRILIAPELGYAFTDRWMVQGKIAISIEDKFSNVGHSLNLRYAFTKRKKLEGYVGMEYSRAESRFLVNGNNGKRTLLEFAPFTGYLYFLQPNIALDVALYYPVYRKSINNVNNSDNSGNMSLRFGLNFYFDSKLAKDSTQRVAEPLNGKWIIGGGATIGSASTSLNVSSRNGFINQLSPYAARMISKRWMTGLRLTYANTSNLQEFYLGLSPFARYYFVQNVKRLLYAEASVGFEYRYLRKNFQSNGLDSTRRSGGLGIGMNRWILPNVALDFLLGGQWGEEKLRLDTAFIFVQRVVLRIGLEAYF